uniref:DP96R CDS n=1 Tax=African swine fever virus TaxID=10497 RepID=A0A7R8Z3E0_ASF|nr:DP96R CDS [African swine fever virus]
MSTCNYSPKEKPVDVNNVSEKSAAVNNVPEKPAIVNNTSEKPVDVNNVSEKSAAVNNALEKPAGANNIPEKSAGRMTSSEWIAEYWKGIKRGNDVPCCCPRKMTSADEKFPVFCKGYLMRSMHKDD